MHVPVTSAIKIKYISYGVTKTGGYRHEKSLYKEAIRYFRRRQEVKPFFIRKYKLFTHLLAYFELVIWAYFKSNGSINIVTARTGISAMIRNRYNKNEVWIVMHNFDPDDHKSMLLKWYYRKLFTMLRKTEHTRFKVITVAPFFVNYFKEVAGIKNTFLFPNLFEVEFYKAFSGNPKNKWIHLGQYSRKNDPAIFKLAKWLKDDGYYCYFSTLSKRDLKRKSPDYEIVFFTGFSEYLSQMSRSICTLALTAINEGWPRLAHESILVGTPVIGYANGGLADLLSESNSMAVSNIEEAYKCIKEGNWNKPEQAFIDKYSTKNAEGYMSTICRNI